ncbi:RES family NAD+ phosphorylase [Flavobacterium sp. UW10123]|uniref:RES family NAD+ phosphorylase n=1 Tax=Flavobacterium sp. UW10123 TaxID=3230800 RepID=UPI00339A6770
MELLSLLDDPVTNLPIAYSNENFRDSLRSILNNFEESCQNADCISSEWISNPDELDNHKEKIKKLIKGLLRSVDIFYAGKPAQAYITFSRTMNDLNITQYLDKGFVLPLRENLFRIRTSAGNYPLSRNELFHIPFEKRGMVNSQRFSIPGLPSLYTSNSIYVAWEEMRRPNVDSIQAVRLVNQRELRLLDITTDIYNNTESSKSDIDVNARLYKVLTWPLAACCSIKVKNRKDAFKPEYIIPQFLLQWVSKKLDGIRYSSTHIDLNKVRHNGQFNNIVLPVKTFKNDLGHCTKLKEIFTCTDVLPMQLRQILASNDRFSHQASIDTNVNKNISELAVIEGTTQIYSQTLFGILEHGLKGLEANPL